MNENNDVIPFDYNCLIVICVGIIKYRMVHRATDTL